MLSHRSTRLFGVLAHVDAGKTTLSERMLYFAGRIHRTGEVHHGTTTLDHTPEERAHGITISSAATTFDWRVDGSVHRLTLIDTPGHVDFAVEVERSLRVLDGAVVVLDAAHGVEPQTEAVWRRVEHYALPRLVFVNKVDAVGASVPACLESLAERLGARPLWLQAAAEDGSLRDLVTGEFVDFTPEGRVQRRPDTSDEGARLRDALVASIAEQDEALLAAWAHGDVPVALLKATLRRLTVERAIVPVLCGSALKNRGVQPLLDAVAAYLPSPDERPLPLGLEARVDRPACAFVFKTEVDAHAGTLAWTRVFQGRLEPGSPVVVARTRRHERVARVLGLHGAALEPLPELAFGHIAALTGLKDVRTGDTLGGASGQTPALDVIEAAEPVVELALQARSPDELGRLSEAVHRACFEDPSLRMRVDEGTGQLVLRGVGELHLSIWLEKLVRTTGLEVRAGHPSVSYRDTLAGPATVTVRNVRQTGGPGQYAVVTMAVEPGQAGTGLSFVDATKGGVIPAPWVLAVEAGVRGAMERGVREDVPLVDVQVRLLDGETHVRDSNAHAFEVAGSLALQQAAAQGGLVRLEPVLHVAVTCPESSLGAVLGEVGARRGAVGGVHVDGPRATVEADLPVSGTFGLVGALRSATEGRAGVTMAPAGYQRVG